MGEHGITHFLEHVIHQGTTSIGVKDPARDRQLLDEIWAVEQELLAERAAQRNLVRERRIFFEEDAWPTTDRMNMLRRRLYELEDQQSQNRIFWREYNWYRQHGGLMRHSDPVPANTGNELMRIEVDLPTSRLEMYFRLEADRMVNAVLRGFEANRYTVLEQFLNFNRTETGRFQEALNGVSGVLHPIYLHPGGHMRDHDFWNRESVLRMYDDYIVPNNAILTLVGAVTAEEIQPLAQEYFGRVPRAPEPPPGMDYAAEPPPGGTVRLDWLEPLSPRVVVRYRIPGVGHPDRPAFDVIARLLSGPEGLLAAAQRGGPQANWGAGASRTGSPSRLSMQADARRDEDLPALEEVPLRAIERLERGDIDGAALAKVKRELRFEWEQTRSHRGDLASLFGDFFVGDDWRTVRTFFEAREATTMEDIQRVARRYLVPWNRVVGITRRNPPSPARGNMTSESMEAAR
jgi:predicted Zn-dependent peptidase